MSTTQNLFADNDSTNQGIAQFVGAIDSLLEDPEYLTINYFLKNEDIHAYGFDRFLAEFSSNYFDLEDLDASRETIQSELEEQMDAINESIAKDALIATLTKAQEEERLKALKALESKISIAFSTDSVASILKAL